MRTQSEEFDFMTTACEKDLEANANKNAWLAYSGTSVTIHVPKDSSVADRANDELSEADQAYEALRNLLSPPEDKANTHVDIYLVDSSDLARDDAAKNGSHKGIRQKSNCEAILRIIDPEEPCEPLARPLTSHLIGRWFGADASSAILFVEGTAGLIGSQIGKAPSVEQADQWVLSELGAGRTVSAVARRNNGKHNANGNGNGKGKGGNGKSKHTGKNGTNGKGKLKRATAPCDVIYAGFDPVSTSFVAFLIEHFGSAALRQYLKTYDPNRQDLAANEAYHQPLAVLEEEWLARLHRRAGNGDVFRSFLGQIVPLLAPYKWKQLEILIYLLLAAGYNVVQPYAIKIFIDRLTAVQKTANSTSALDVFLKSLAPFLLLLLGIYIVNGVVSLRRAYTVNWLNQNILSSLQLRMYAHLQRLSHSFYVNAKVGDIMARLNSDLDNVQQALSQVTNKALYRGFTVVGAVTALVMLTRKSPELAVPILAIVPLFVAFYVALRTRNKQASREQRRRVGQVMATVQEHLSAHALIKAFRLEDRFIADYRSRILALQQSKLRLAMLSALTDLSEDMTTGLAQLIVFGVGGYLVLRDNNNGLGVGDLAALLVLVKSIFSPIASLSGIGQTMQQATGSLERVHELFEEPVTVTDKPGAIELPPMEHEISLENVTFRYGGDRRILKNLTMKIPAKAHVAIVGPSGSGKTTIINLLLRFWDPEEGRILFDGHDLRDVTLASLRGQIGLVFQETFIFNTTLRANIAIGRPDATDAEIVAAAKAARLHNFISSLPLGYDTIPGESGARLSVGQKQRIAIARTFLRNPAVLILDEATSALDAQTEAAILEMLSELAEGRTTISITHRISQASTADVIFVMAGGSLVEQGSHSDLVAADGLYKKLYDEATGFVTNGAQHEPAKSAA